MNGNEYLESQIVNNITTVNVPGYEKFYKISSNGDIFSYDRKVPCKQGYRTIPGRKIKHRVDSHGYKYVTFTNEQKQVKSYRIHRLLMMIFRPVNNMENLVVNHLDGNPSNNALDNLEWCTKSENTKHALMNGLIRRPFGEFTEDYWEAILILRNIGWSNAKIGRAFGKSPSSIRETLVILGIDISKKGRFGGKL